MHDNPGATEEEHEQAQTDRGREEEDMQSPEDPDEREPDEEE
ncbi:MAG TPA: hypothetical protein VHD91_02185 [Gaiellaceae bacterium]|nr:hypothetical protein [Gaiellaceae bacterium]